MFVSAMSQRKTEDMGFVIYFFPHFTVSVQQIHQVLTAFFQPVCIPIKDNYVVIICWTTALLSASTSDSISYFVQYDYTRRYTHKLLASVVD